MRIALSLLSLLLLAPRVSSADAILVTQSDESRITYGTFNAVHYGLSSFTSMRIYRDGIQQPLDWHNVGTSFKTVSGPLLQQTLETNSAGEIIGSIYLYEASMFVMEFNIHNSVTDETRDGFFVAPIIRPIRVAATEKSIEVPEIPDYDSVEIFYRLGPGLFDDSIASAFGIRRRTAGGDVFDPYLTFGTGDPTTSERTAWEGAPTVTIRVPEPASLILLGSACLGLVARRRRAQRRPS